MVGAWLAVVLGTAFRAAASSSSNTAATTDPELGPEAALSPSPMELVRGLLRQSFSEYAAAAPFDSARLGEACAGEFAAESEPFGNALRMHVPKTGTSLTMALRTLLHACYGLDHQDLPCWEGQGSRNLPDDHCSDHLYDCNGHCASRRGSTCASVVARPVVARQQRQHSI
jgi:hypothetical protein